MLLMKKLSIYFLIALVAILAMYFSYQNANRLESNEQDLNAQQVIFETNKGSFTVELNANKSPQSVLNFVEYIKSGFYSQTIFHRVIPGVIIQGGGFNSNMQAKETRPAIINESNNQLVNRKGTISMARRTSANSATSQFFINLRDNPKLDYRDNQHGYAVFGKVVEGLALLEKLAKTKTRVEGTHEHFPVDEIKIIDVKLIAMNGLTEIKPSETKRADSRSQENTHQEKFVEGVHYVLLKEPVDLLDTNKIEVVSAFSFGCGHCYGVYPLTQKWSQDNKNIVSFSYFHAVWNNAMRLYARTYYAAIALKVETQIHLPLFEAIVINQQKLSNRDEIAEFFENYGIDRTKFVQAFDSDEISKRVEQAEKLTKAFSLASVPEFIVAGKYRIDPMRAGGQQEIFEVIDYLVARELKNLKQ